METDESGIDWQQVRQQLPNPEDIGSRQRPRQRRRLLQRRAERYRREKKRGREQTVDLVMFRRCQERYAVELHQLEEIRKDTEIRAVPGVSPVIVGVINVRGQIVAVHDLAVVTSREVVMPEEPWVVVGNTGEVAVGLIADDVTGVRRPQRSDVRAAPMALQQRGHAIRGVFDRDILLLEMEGLASNEEFFMA